MIGKNSIEGARAPSINIVVNYCCTRVLLYAKMLKETKAEKTIVFFVTFLSLVAFQLGGEGSMGSPSGYAYGRYEQQSTTVKKCRAITRNPGVRTNYDRVYSAYEFRRKYVCDNE